MPIFKPSEYPAAEPFENWCRSNKPNLASNLKRLNRRDADNTLRAIQAEYVADQKRKDAKRAAGIAETVHDIRAELAAIPASLKAADARVADLLKQLDAVTGTTADDVNTRAKLRDEITHAERAAVSIRTNEASLRAELAKVDEEVRRLKRGGHDIAKFSPAEREARRLADWRSFRLGVKSKSFGSHANYQEWAGSIESLVDGYNDAADDDERDLIRHALALEEVVIVNGTPVIGTADELQAILGAA